jgi:HSP20 family protein
MEDVFPAFASMRRNVLRSFFEPFSLEPLIEAAEFPVDLYEKDGIYAVEAALPGFKKENIRVEASGDVVTISASTEREREEESALYRRREISRRSVTRTVQLPAEIDPENVKAHYENGVLRITLKPMKALRNKNIPISGD